MARRALVLAAIAAGLVLSCRPPGPGPAVPPIVGQVDWPENILWRKIQAYTPGYVASAGTVELIDPYLGKTVATTISDDRGGFSLEIRGFVPDANTAYYLEAVKGLGNHSAGWPAVRLRTLIHFKSGNWLSLTRNALVISKTTTALTVFASLMGVDNVEPRDLIESVTPGAIDDSLSPPTPDTLSPVPGVTNEDFHRFYGWVGDALDGDMDPFHVILLTGVSTSSTGNQGGPTPTPRPRPTDTPAPPPPDATPTPAPTPTPDTNFLLTFGDEVPESIWNYFPDDHANLLVTIGPGPTDRLVTPPPPTPTPGPSPTPAPDANLDLVVN